MANGKLIVIEGGDGSGKQTQTRLLVERLKKSGLKVESMDFPQCKTTFYGHLIREYLDGRFGDPKQVPPQSASVLYCMDRFESKKTIEDWLKDGRVVICDRFHTANIIHQGAKLEENFRLDQLLSFLDEFEFGLLRVPRPDAVIYLHVFPEVSQLLMDKQGRVKDGHENDLTYAQKVEKTALWACGKFSWKKIECCPDKKSILPEAEIHKLIWQEVEKLIF